VRRSPKATADLRVGIGFGTADDPRQAASEAARQALEGSGEPSLTLLFTTEHFDQQEAFLAVAQLVGSSALAGACTAGLIGPEGVMPRGIAVCTLAGSSLDARTALAPIGGADARQAGRAAAGPLKGSGGGTLLVFPDGFAADISEVVRGLYDALGPEVLYVGGGTGDNLRFFRTYQFGERGVATGSVSACLLRGPTVACRLGHGWMPRGAPLVVTRAEGKVVHELDGWPALEVYSGRLGGIDPDRFADYGARHPLGIPDAEGNFLIRDPLRPTPEGGIEFVTEVPPNTLAFMMSASADDLIGTARRVAREARSAVERPRLALIFDCVSRYLVLQDRFDEELAAMREELGPEVPCVGFLTFGEVGAFSDVPFFHNKTVAVALVGE